MTKSEIFRKAHQAAKATVSVVGDYAIAFSLALKNIHASVNAVAKKITSVTFSFGNKEITHTVNSDSASRWEKNGLVRDYFTVTSSHKVTGLDALYEVISGTTRDQTVTVDGRTFGYTTHFADSKTKRRALESAALELAAQL